MNLYCPTAIVLSSTLSLCTLLQAQMHTANFENGSITPFNVEVIPGNVSEVITPTTFPARDGSKVHRIVWKAENYNGQRTGRSVEATSTPLERITGEGWYAFSFYAPESFPVPDKVMALGQIIAWHHSLPKTNITITVGVDKSGAVILEGAYGVGDGNKVVSVYTTLAPTLTKGTWHDVILYCKFSRNNTGILRAWYNGAPEDSPSVEYTGINLGNGGWDSDEKMTYGAYIKWGPYCWDHANYVPGESREIYYDAIAYEIGNTAGAFDRVKQERYGENRPLADSDAIILSETFIDMPVGARPIAWEVHNDASTSASVRNTPDGTGKCLRFWDDNPSGHTQAWKSFVPQRKPFTASWKFMQTGDAAGHRMELLCGNKPALSIVSDGSGNLALHPADGADTVFASASANDWHQVEVLVRPEQARADIYVDGTQHLSDIPLPEGIAFLDRIRFGSSDATVKHHLFVDEVLIRQAPGR